MAEIAPVQPQRAVDQVTERLRAAILDGTYPAGERLPPERALAESLAVNRLTLRSALARLEAEGLVRPRHGDGVRVLPFERSAGVALLPDLLEGDDPALLRAFLELRRALAVEAVALACERATEENLERLRALAAAQAEEEDLAAFAERDLEFGREVLRAAQNLPMQLLLNTVAEVHRRRPELRDALYADRGAVRASYLAVFALLKARDQERARALVRSALAAQDELALERFAKRRRGRIDSTSAKSSKRRR